VRVWTDVLGAGVSQLPLLRREGFEMSWRGRKAALALIPILISFQSPVAARSQLRTPPLQGLPAWLNVEISSSQVLAIGGASIQVDFAAGALDLDPPHIIPWVQAAARAVTAYYGKFPVPRARILIIPIPGRQGIVQGTTWGDMDGYPGLTRIRLGQHTTLNDLSEDWTMTHELVHMAFPSLPDNQHWMEEGLATYVEPIARVQTGELSAQKIWADMVHDMPKGEPSADDQGLDRTHTWGRTYWGGAMFCLVADVAIRRQTNNRKGLQDALRAIVIAGGTIDHQGSLPEALQVGDKATGTTVLTDMYKKWSDKPVPVDLPGLWSELGIKSSGGSIEFLSPASLAKVREAITVRRE
jgi:hypothetical protein